MSSALGWWSRWWQRARAAPRTPIELVLYTRAGCGACERLERELAPLRARWNLVLHKRDIGGDAQLERRYGLRIPVLAVAGRELEGQPPSARDIERALECAARAGAQP
jgi:hypothetical protein